MRLLDRLRAFFRRPRRTASGGGRVRGPATHVVILDGTMSRLDDGFETHAGQLYKLLREAGVGANLTVYYEPGIQWVDWRSTLDVMQGRGINRQIMRAYGVLATRYRAGDRIVLAGYSRGAYAVRSLAGVMDRVGLVRSDAAIERTIRQAYRHYKQGGDGPAARTFRATHCHDTVHIEAVAVWDTVRALGLRLPLLWRLSTVEHAFHNHALSPIVRNGFHALALDERRDAYTPVLWSSPKRWDARIEQVWFPGTHGDVGGHIDGNEAVRPFANLSLVWMLGRLEECGLTLPAGWRSRFEVDATAPSVGQWRGWSKLFLSRRARAVGRDPSERLHPSVGGRELDLPVWDAPTV